MSLLRHRRSWRLPRLTFSASGLLVGVVGVASVSVGACAGGGVPDGTVQRVSGRAIEFPAAVDAAAFAGAGPMAGYHFVVWDGGNAADAALFRSRARDVEVLEALEALGAAPGDALTIDTWEERDDASATAPDRIVEGPGVRVLVRVPGRAEPLALADILADAGERGFEMRFGGHRGNVPEWHSGCVVCLYSCPGGKIGNARYTVRDFVRGVTHFRVRPGVLPPDGTEVTIRVELEG